MNQNQITKNSILKVNIVSMSTDGRGIGKTEENFTVFIPGTAIGDVIMTKIIKVNKNYAIGIIDAIVVPSIHRIEPTCSTFKKCGGCCFRHISYDHELEIKHSFVKNNLQRIGGVDIEVMPVVPSPKIDHYRNKAQYPIGTDENDNVAIGFYSKRSHKIIDNSFCHLQPKEFEPILKAIKKFVVDYNIPIYNEKKHTGLLRHLFIRQAVVTGELMVSLVLNGKNMPYADELVKSLIAVNKNISSITININKKKTNVILGKEEYCLYGKNYISDKLCNLSFDISALSFYQVNHDAAENLYKIAADMADLKGDEILVDLYCGTGTIGLTMAHKVKLLIGVDVVEEAIQNATKNAENNNLDNAWFICGDAKLATAKLKSQQLSPDVIILDPPRKGCDIEVLDQISSMQPEKIVMISCDSATLSRDIKILGELGYDLIKVQPVDMFPRTHHVETCVLLSHKNPQTSPPSL